MSSFWTHDLLKHLVYISSFFQWILCGCTEDGDVQYATKVFTEHVFYFGKRSPIRRLAKFSMQTNNQGLHLLCHYFWSCIPTLALSGFYFLDSLLLEAMWNVPVDFYSLKPTNYSGFGEARCISCAYPWEVAFSQFSKIKVRSLISE